VDVFLAFWLFLALTAATWFVSVAVYRSFFVGHDPAASPSYRRVAAIAIGLVTMACYRGFPAGYVVSVLVWTAVAFFYLNLPRWRAAVFAALLALGSFLTRLMALGALEFF
jgi:hypothetical protein